MCNDMSYVWYNQLYYDSRHWQSTSYTIKFYSTVLHTQTSTKLTDFIPNYDQCIWLMFIQLPSSLHSYYELHMFIQLQWVNNKNNETKNWYPHWIARKLRRLPQTQIVWTGMKRAMCIMWQCADRTLGMWQLYMKKITQWAIPKIRKKAKRILSLKYYSHCSKQK